jgi:hypothetical protein
VSEVAAVHPQIIDGDDLVTSGAGAGGRIQGVGILRRDPRSRDQRCGVHARIQRALAGGVDGGVLGSATAFNHQGRPAEVPALLAAS